MSSGLRILSVILEMLTLRIWDPSPPYPSMCVCVLCVYLCEVCHVCATGPPKQVLLVDLPCRFQASWPKSFWGIFCIYLCFHSHAGTLDYATTSGFPWLLGIQTPVLSFPESP